MSFNVKRASANSIINRVLSNANGIGESKSLARKNSEIKGSNGHKVSTKAHSIKELQNLRSVTKQYVNYVKEVFDGKVATNINADSAKNFLEHKLQEVSAGTLNTYISSLNKIVDNLQKDGIGNLSRADIKEIKTDLKEVSSLKSDHINRGYQDTESIRLEMKDTPFALNTDLQIQAGLRVSDALDSSKWQVNPDNSLTINGSKGGINYNTAPLTQNIIERIDEYIKNAYRPNIEEYRQALKEAVERTNQAYNGSHGLRYSFAQNRVEELIKEGYTKDEALGQTSLELGHSRLEITKHYMGK